MSGRRFSIGLRAALAIFIVTLFVTSTWAQAPWERVLFSFNGTDGSYPAGSLIRDSHGLFGTTLYGGAYGYGTVFQLSHKVGGGWAHTVLHSFNGTPDGAVPFGLIMDAAGNLYGTATQGGLYTYGYGTVYELRQQGVGLWTYRVLHSFTGSSTDGASPSGLILDAAGNLYGTTYGGGDLAECPDGGGGCGTVFELSHKVGGGWTEKVLHSFSRAYGSPGGLIFDAAGNLYGTTPEGGAYGYGTVFELSPEADGSWTEKVLYSFPGGADGISPGGLIFDAAGNLYGTSGGSDYGVPDGYGTVFELSPEADGSWTEKVLYTFRPGTDGIIPGGLIFDTRGNLYGTTYQGGLYGTTSAACAFWGCGVVFELSPNAGGSWTYSVLHRFDPNCHNDGAAPSSGLIMDAAANLYGTTCCFGAYGGSGGTVYEITP